MSAIQFLYGNARKRSPKRKRRNALVKSKRKRRLSSMRRSSHGASHRAIHADMASLLGRRNKRTKSTRVANPVQEGDQSMPKRRKKTRRHRKSSGPHRRSRRKVSRHRKHRARRVKPAMEYMTNPRRRRRRSKHGNSASFKHSKHRRRVRRRMNPDLKALVSDSKSMLMSFESLGLLIGGAVNPVISGFVDKVLPAAIVNTINTIPAGSSIVPAIIGLLANSFGKGKVKEIGKGIVGAAIVQTGYDIGQLIAGMSGGMIPGFAGYVSNRTGQMAGIRSGTGLNFGTTQSRTGIDFGAVKSYPNSNQANFGKPTLVLSGPSIIRGRLAGGSEADSDILGPSFVADGDMISGGDAQLG